MRPKERIPIILDLLEDNYIDFLIDIGIGEENRGELIDLYLLKRNEIEEFWLNNPDLRLRDHQVIIANGKNVINEVFNTYPNHHITEKI